MVLAQDNAIPLRRHAPGHHRVGAGTAADAGPHTDTHAGTRA